MDPRQATRIDSYSPEAPEAWLGAVTFKVTKVIEQKRAYFTSQIR